MASNQVKRNISAILIAIGVICIIARIYGVATEPKSLKAWFELAGITLLTYICFDNFMIYRRRKNNPDKSNPN